MKDPFKSPPILQARPSVRLNRMVDLPRIFHHRIGRDIDVNELTVALLEPPNIDVLNNITLDRIDHDRPTRAVELLARHELDVLQAIDAGAESSYGIINQMRAVPGRN